MTVDRKLLVEGASVRYQPPENKPVSTGKITQVFSDGRYLVKDDKVGECPVGEHSREALKCSVGKVHDS
ncbi:hypothetical protein BC938DRAFT_474673 [Jimgerdemannia flammicorona]|uniref:Uncharacterized protein n=1 Tax=Jimgerdemannia flammicorona TaxID=994334 RepID=A0A433QS91_9FUNG|nr:hypothetical protein BC938DRAFT_474673 [Jimgerdemannia flammicorona]